MDEMGKAMMGTGEAEGENRAVQAAEKAIANPLLDEISLEGARGVLINITGGYDLTLFELDEAANKIREKVDAEANIIVGSTLDTGMEGRMRVSVVATGIDAIAKSTDVPTPRRSMAQPLAQAAATEEVAAAPAPAAEPAPTFARTAAPAPAPYQEPVPARAPEPSLFASMDDQRQVQPVADDFSDMHAAIADDDSDLPPPAYQPREEVAAVESFVAPRAAPAGTPSPEAMARLQAAVGRTHNPNAAAEPTPNVAEGDKPRFGINSLINRMTGAGAEQQQPAREAPQVQALREEPEVDPEQERIEIPAFLRRQAN
jgi:cell division protein FtsZ